MVEDSQTLRDTKTGENVSIRNSIVDYAIAMELEIRRKKAAGVTNDGMKLIDYVDKLHEERYEVDEELIKAIYNGDTKAMNKLVKEEILHEGIMLVLTRDFIKGETKE